MLEGKLTRERDSHCEGHLLNCWGTGGKRKRGQQGLRWLESITYSTDMNLVKLQETVRDREAWHAAVHGLAKRHN